MISVSRSKPLLGTFVEITLSAELPKQELHAICSLAFERIEALQALLSFHDPESELTKINLQANTAPVPVSKDLFTVLSLAFKLSELSKGAYDVTVAPHFVHTKRLPAIKPWVKNANWQAVELNNQSVLFREDVLIDLGGIAKGYAVDAAFELIKQQKVHFQQVSVNAGGDLRLLNWKDTIVAVRYPSFLGKDKLKEISMCNTALATSSSGQGSPSSDTVNPSSGKVKGRNKSYSVFAESCIIADALTKLVCLAPEPKGILTEFSAKALSINSLGNIKWFK